MSPTIIFFSTLAVLYGVVFGLPRAHRAWKQHAADAYADGWKRGYACAHRELVGGPLPHHVRDQAPPERG